MDGNKSNVNPTDAGEWGRLTPEQKREQRIAWWRSSAETINFISMEAGDAYRDPFLDYT